MTHLPQLARLLGILALLCHPLFGQQPQEARPPSPSAAVPQTRPSPDRWEPEIQLLEKRAAGRAHPHVDAVFIGSSSIRLWDLAHSFPEVDALNQGFGGSHLADSVAFFSRLVTPHSPRAIVLYAGDNDLSAGLSPQQVADDFRQFLNLVITEAPTCQKVIFIAIKPSLARWHLRDRIQEANSLVAEICEESPVAVFADIWLPTLDEQGEPRGDLLQADGLHLNPVGYEFWQAVVAPELSRALAPSPNNLANPNCLEARPQGCIPASRSRLPRVLWRLLR